MLSFPQPPTGRDPTSGHPARIASGSIIWLGIKIAALLFLFIWVRATLPRLRYDRLMKFGWKVLLPVATANLLVTAVIVGLMFAN